MATGLIALLDDVVAISKIAAASLDDIGAQAAKSGAKAAGVVIDDAAVTPAYATGFAANRELPIVGKIALGSFKNKLLILLPAAILMSEFAPWAVTPLLMIGGLYLSYEGAEKVWEAVGGHKPSATTVEAMGEDLKALEKKRINGAIQTDFILSAEVMAISLAAIEDPDWVMRTIILATVAIGITIVVYGAVALIVKADDIGVSLALPHRPAPVRAIGRGLVKGMPTFLKALTVVGTIAMLWVGGGIIAHGLHELGWHLPDDVLKAIGGVGAMSPVLPGVFAWAAQALGSAAFGIALGAVVIVALTLFGRDAEGHKGQAAH